MNCGNEIHSANFGKSLVVKGFSTGLFGCALRCKFPVFPFYDVGVKSSNNDAYGLFRALHFHNPASFYSITNIENTDNILRTIFKYDKIFHITAQLQTCDL